jgi:general secretion pathway protein G
MTSIKIGLMHCQRCGNLLAPGARFCNSCGTPVSTTAPAAPISMARPGLVTAIAILHFFGAAMMLISALVLIASGSSSTASDRTFALVFAAIMLVLGVASLLTGIGLWKMRDWGRTLQIVLACIGLLAIPLGTIISILLLVYFTRPHVRILFSGKRRDQLTPEEASIMAAAGSGGGASGVVIAIVAVVVIIGFIGILAAIAIPNLLTAMQRAKQKRTMADIRQMASSVEEYKAANNKPPESIKIMKDGWGNNFRYANDGTNYWIVSGGKDGKFEENEAWHYQHGGTTNFDCDIVLSNGEFQRYPEGVQQR